MDLINKYKSNSDIQKDNANISKSYQGMRNFIVEAVIKDHWKNIYDEYIMRLHDKGYMHIHDLGSYSVYCVGWDLEDVLTRGFGGVEGQIQCSQPKYLSSALGQIMAFLYTLQGEAAGAQAFSNFDTLLAPIVHFDPTLRFEDGTYNKRIIRKRFRDFLFQMNVPTRVGGQTPFTNITMDLSCPNHLKVKPIFMKNHNHRTYGEFQTEMDIINEVFCEVMLEGDESHRPFTFPIPTYNISADFDWDNPKFTNLWKMTGKYGYPYFGNFVNSDLKADDVMSMCCRLRLDKSKLQRRGGSLFASSALTGSIGVVTLNLNKIAIKTKIQRADFLSRIDSILEAAKDSLVIKRRILEEETEGGLYPYTKYYLPYSEKNGTYWHNHYNTIGIIAMNEAIETMFGYGIDTPEGKTFALNVLDHINEKLEQFQEETGYLFNLEATPAEGVTRRFVELDKKKYPDFMKDVDYYTNSTCLPVHFTNDLFYAINHQSDLQDKYTGGTVFHCFLGESIDDPVVVKKLVKTITQNTKIPYFSLTPTYTVCPKHGYFSGNHEQCPMEN